MELLQLYFYFLASVTNLKLYIQMLPSFRDQVFNLAPNVGYRWLIVIIKNTRLKNFLVFNTNFLLLIFILYMLVIMLLYMKFISIKYWPLGPSIFLFFILLISNYPKIIIYCECIKLIRVIRNNNIDKILFHILKDVWKKKWLFFIFIT